MEAVDEEQLEHDVDDVRGDDDLERPAQVRDAAQVALARERDERRRQPERRDPEVDERVLARPPVPAEPVQQRAASASHTTRSTTPIPSETHSACAASRAARSCWPAPEAARHDRRRPVGEEVEDRERAREHRPGEPERRDLRPPQMADDRRVHQHVERLRRERAERRQGQPQDPAIVW